MCNKLDKTPHKEQGIHRDALWKEKNTREQQKGTAATTSNTPPSEQKKKVQGKYGHQTAVTQKKQARHALSRKIQQTQIHHHALQTNIPDSHSPSRVREISCAPHPADASA